MKALHKRKRRRRGRPPVESPAQRTATGQLSRARGAVEWRERESEKDAVAVAVQARMRATGLPEAMARQPFAGSALGLLLFDRKITREQFDAGNRYAEDLARYYGLTGVPFPSPRAQNLFQTIRGGQGEEPQSKIAAARIASNRMMELETILGTCSNHPNAPKSCCFAVCVLNELSSRNWPPATIGYLRAGLTALAGFYGGKRW